MKDIGTLNAELCAMDIEINELFRRRTELTKELSEAKQAAGSAFRTSGGESFRLYRDALRAVRGPVSSPRVVYQGTAGAYSEMACIDFFGKDVEAIGLRTFEDTFRALKKGEADYAVLPIENSSTGAIRQVYDLLTHYECFMVGETSVFVRHVFAALQDAELSDITTVYSHEQGLFQCEPFLSGHPDWKCVPYGDTAGSAKAVSEIGDRHIAAICSSRAAEIYGLKVLKDGVNYNADNTTRFVVVSPKIELREGRDKICISFTTAHESGSLYEVLRIFTVNGLNLVRLESRPVIGRNWEYMFFVEFTGDLTDPRLAHVMPELMDATNRLRVFGNFRSNLKSEDTVSA